MLGTLGIHTNSRQTHRIGGIPLERLFAKCPKVIVFGEDIPYTTTGKPKRLELKSQLGPLLESYRDVQFKERHLRE